MELDSQERQLEFFDSARSSSEHARQHEEGVVRFRLRYDQCILVSIGLFIGLSVIFAMGVERGKRLVRSERPIALPAIAFSKTAGASVSERPEEKKAKPQTLEKAKETGSRNEAPEPKLEPKPSEQKRVVQEQSRYAIQVVTYTQTQRAVQELQSLREKGETAFLVKRNGMTMVYVGPFPSKDNAREKLVTLKHRYQDCFVRSL